MIGTTISHYEVRERLGGGAMGEVFKAWDTRLERFVALKFLAPELGRDPELRERFQREAKATSSLDHPNLCVIHDVDETADGRMFICMAFYEGETLKARLRRGPLPVPEARGYAIQIARGLYRAHEAGIIHRDLKPANVMLTRHGEAKIVDFGLAKLLHEAQITRTGAALGTFAYMSPEQLRGEEVDGRTDLWSLGVVLYEMMAGVLPFGGHAVVTQRQILDGPPPDPPSSVRPGVPKEIDELVARLLTRQREERIGSALEVIRDLASSSHPLLSSLPTEMAMPTAARPPAAARLTRGLRIAGAVGVLAAAGIVTWMLLGRDVAAAPAYQTLAVLPFDNYTGDPGRDYLGEGLAAGLITSLSEISGLQVLSRVEAWGERASASGATDLGHRLGVGAILAGSLAAAGDELKVDVRLIGVDDGSVLWSESFADPGNDLQALQQRIAERLTEVLRIPVSRAERQRLARNPTRSLRAYDLYLQGQKHLDQPGDPRAPEEAGERFREALRLDPGFALARVGLSEAYWRLFVRDRDPGALRDAESEAERALKLDPQLPAARVAMARVYRSRGRAADSVRDLERALREHPNPDEAYRELGRSYERMDDLESAESAYRAAIRVGSEFWLNWNTLGSFYHRVGNYDEARSAFDRAVEEAPEGVTLPGENLIANEFYRGKPEEVLAAFEAWDGPVRGAGLASNIGTAYYYSERPDKWEKAEEYFRLAVELNPRDDEAQRNLADLLRVLGQEEEAIQHYREALRLVAARLEQDPGDRVLSLRWAFYAANVRECEAALATMDRVGGDLPDSASLAHLSAYVYSLCDRPDRAIEAVEKAIDLGLPASLIGQEPEFAPLRGDPRFERLTAGDPVSPG